MGHKRREQVNVAAVRKAETAIANVEMRGIPLSVLIRRFDSLVEFALVKADNLREIQSETGEADYILDETVEDDSNLDKTDGGDEDYGEDSFA